MAPISEWEPLKQNRHSLHLSLLLGGYLMARESLGNESTRCSRPNEQDQPLQSRYQV